MKPCAPVIFLATAACLFAGTGQSAQIPVRITINVGKAERNLLHKVEPVYPRMARIAHVQGDVRLRAVISKEGKVASLQALSGPSMLIQASLDAVKQWEYKPFLLNGQPVEVETPIVVHFHL